MWRGKKYYIARTERESKRRFAKSRNTRRNERNTTTTTGGRICVNNCVFSFIASLLFFFLFYFFFLPVILFRFLWTFSHFCKNRGTSYNKPLVFFFFFERTLRSTLISKVGTTCLGLKNIMYSLCKYCYDQLCSFQFRLLPSRSLAFSAPIVVFLPFFS